MSCQALGTSNGSEAPTVTPQPTVGGQANVTGNAQATPTPATGKIDSVPSFTATATVIATVIPVEIPEPAPNNTPSLLFTSPPFKGDHPVLNFFDHDLPFQWRDKNGFQLTPWGGKTSGIEGHSGYDWVMPIGTPLYAVADGVVRRAGPAEPFMCAPLKRMVTDSLGVIVMHRGLGGRSVFAYYGHMSRVDVKEGDLLKAGDPVGLSGDTGCAIEPPHLHFGVWVRWGEDPQTFIDPFGWEGDTPDPWLEHEEGKEKSYWLWNPGVAPKIYRETELSEEEAAKTSAPVIVRYVRWMGWRDDRHPNNEVVRIEANPKAGGGTPISLAGYKLTNDQGAEFVFPQGAWVAPGRPVWVYTGSGQDTDTFFFWNQGMGVWDDMAGCASLLDPGGTPAHRLGFIGPESKVKPPCSGPDKARPL